jgi:hypothetical protein
MIDYRKLIDSLLLIRLGQELGTDSPLARAVAELLDLALKQGFF